MAVSIGSVVEPTMTEPATTDPTIAEPGAGDSGRSELSFGQLYSWREIEAYPLDGRQEANLPATWDLRGTTMAQVQAALRALVRRHEVLRTTYHVVSGVPWQQVATDIVLPIEQTERAITDMAEPDRITAELLDQAIPMTDCLGWRGLLVGWDGAPMFISLSFSHLIVDVWSVIELGQQFRTLLDDPDDERPSGPSPRLLAARQREGLALGRQRVADRYWAQALDPTTGPGLPTIADRARSPRIQATLHSTRVGALAAAAAATLSVTPPAVLVGLISAGLGQYLGRDQFVVNLMSSNRFPRDHRRVVGTMNQLVPVVAVVDRDSSVAAHITRLHWAGATAYRHSSYDVDRMIAADRPGDHQSDGGFNRLFPCWFNYLQLDDRAPDPRDRGAAEVEWNPAARGFGQPIDVRVTVRGGHTSIALRTDPDLVPAPALAAILKTVAAGAEWAVTRPADTIAELWAGRDDAVAPELFPTIIRN